jgi:hypothetical protein
MALALPSLSSVLQNPSSAVCATRKGYYLNGFWVVETRIDSVPNRHKAVREFISQKATELLQKIPSQLESWGLSKQEIEEFLFPLFKKLAYVYPYWLYFLRAMSISSSFGELENTLTRARMTHLASGWIPNPKESFFLVAAFLVAVNTMHFFKEVGKEQIENQTPPSFTNRLLAFVWKATPYLIIITNIAITALQIYQGFSMDWLTLVATGVTLLPLTNLMPDSFSVYLYGCTTPIDAAAFWYGDSYARMYIIKGWIFRAIF